MSLLQFAPFVSAIDSGFWYQFSQKKLDVFKLDDGPVNIHGFYTNSSSPGLPPIFNVDYSAMEEPPQIPPSGHCVKGVLLNTNTLEEFKLMDKRHLLQEVAAQVFEAIEDGRALEDPSLLQRHVCLTFADLKQFRFYYWMAFPALTYPESVVCEGQRSLSDDLTQEQLDELERSHALLSPSDRAAFLVHLGEGCSAHPLRERHSLAQGKILLGFADPSGYANHPGWPLRNVLALAVHQWGGVSWEVVCLRGRSSIVLSLRLDGAPAPTGGCPGAVGWEMLKGKLLPRVVDMSASMDPERLAEGAVDLNLRLMRWRLCPELRLESIRGARCLLLGAGTLGCNVARCLLGWGVRHVTLLDNSSVSYSNPVRQSLYFFEDSKGGGVQKATAAAATLRKIFPGVNAEGRVLSVPMPGHAIPENMRECVLAEVSELERLVEEHDVLFLLTDTRESRWLPTLLGALHRKLVLNAALGFDTFLVMRHGLKTDEATNGLGCYFCNDVVAPGNSTQGRTLDQQCTVTRPGLSYVAAALAVELFASLLQHPKGGLAPASGDCELGLVPHQVRGYMDRFQNIVLTSQAFDQCTACSPKVQECYLREGFEFLLRVFNDPNHLEQVTGLAQLTDTVSMDEILALSDDDSG